MECLLHARPVPNLEDKEKNKAQFPTLRRILCTGGDRHINKQLHCNAIGARIERWTANCGNTGEEVTPSGGVGDSAAEKQHLAGAQGKQRS